MHAAHADRLSNLVAAYLNGQLELGTCVAELTHVYVEHGWAFYLVEAECEPAHLERMRALADRMDAAVGGEVLHGAHPDVAGVRSRRRDPPRVHL
jgi:hypothetical protein